MGGGGEIEIAVCEGGGGKKFMTPGGGGGGANAPDGMVKSVLAIFYNYNSTDEEHPP